MKRTSWEYHVLIRDLIDETASADAYAEVRRLGEDGWELVSVHYLTAYAPSLETPRMEDDVIRRMRKRLNDTFARMNDASAAPRASTNGGVGVGVGVGVEVHAPPPRIEALPETRLEAWFKRPA